MFGNSGSTATAPTTTVTASGAVNVASTPDATSLVSLLAVCFLCLMVAAGPACWWLLHCVLGRPKPEEADDGKPATNSIPRGEGAREGKLSLSGLCKSVRQGLPMIPLGVAQEAY